MSAGTSQAARNAEAREQARRAVGPLAVQPAGTVQYRSRGRILLIGGEDALLFAPRLLPDLQPQVLVTDGSDEPSVPAIPLAGRPLAIRGHLGAFEVSLGQPGARDHERLHCDLILDLDDPPHLPTPLPPPGYYRADPDQPLVLDALALELVQMRGTFEKPRFFHYDAARCAHGRSGLTGCRACLDACPAEAITALAERIAVDPYRCQGGGACAAVCPSGAIEYALPPPLALHEQARRLLRAYRAAGGERPVLAFVSGDAAAARDAPHVLWLPVEEVPAVGLELWLDALAHGAAAVRLVHAEPLPAPSAAALDRQLRLAATLLGALGYPADAVRRVAAADFDPHDRPAGPLPPAARYAAAGDKRQRAFTALDHLHAHAPRPVDAVDLPPGAPFGEVALDRARCTLCMACTSTCPAGALLAGGDQPRLRFIEAHCVQCGLCVQACPEDALRLAPRLLFDHAARHAPRTLHEEAPFCCVQCGKPFATRRLIDTVLARLAGNPMFQTERARRRLQMCEDCRVLDIADDEEAQLGGLLDGGRHAP